MVPTVPNIKQKLSLRKTPCNRWEALSLLILDERSEGARVVVEYSRSAKESRRPILIGFASTKQADSLTVSGSDLSRARLWKWKWYIISLSNTSTLQRIPTKHVKAHMLCWRLSDELGKWFSDACQRPSVPSRHHEQDLCQRYVNIGQALAVHVRPPAHKHLTGSDKSNDVTCASTLLVLLLLVNTLMSPDGPEPFGLKTRNTRSARKYKKT